MEKMNYDVLIIGAGPAGYVAAIRAGQVGLKALLIDKDKVGGMCVNWGCIPSKSMIESAKLYYRLNQAEEFGIEGINLSKTSLNWKKAIERARSISAKMHSGIEFLLHKNGVETIIGKAVITGENTVTVNKRSITSKNIIIATGSYPRESSRKGIKSIKALYGLNELPETIAIEGNGAVAVETAQLVNLAGSKAYLVSDDNELVPGVDKYINDYLRKQLKSQGISIVKNDKNIDADMWVNANLRSAIWPESEIKIEATEEGFINTNTNLQTNIPSIYAIGDVNGRSSYAHAGSAQGQFVINKIKGVKGGIELGLYPINLYTFPEIAQIGATEQILQEEEINYKISEFPLSMNAKAMISGQTEGVVRILSESKYGEVLGVQIIAEHATDMIAEASAFMEMEATVYDVAKTVHAHPTISEVFMEAGFDAFDKSIHKQK
jgi:dihydrolipoamide dehydrogenase